MKKKVTILYHKKQMSRIEKISKGDWIDLRLAETVTLKKGEYQLLSLGVSIKLPKGYEALVAPRSSTFKNYGVIMANSIGIIDETYCGTNDIWRFPALATRDITIPADTRIAQFRIIKHQPKIEFIIADKLSNSNRCGIGSTGTK